MVADVEPVTDVHSVAIDGNRLSLEQALNDHWNELLWKLIGPIVVGAIGNDGRQAVGVVISAHEHVAGGFAGRVRRVRGIGSGFGKMTRRAETAIDFIRRDVEEASAGGGRGGIQPGGAAGFEEVESADDVRVNEIAR